MLDEPLGRPLAVVPGDRSTWERAPRKGSSSVRHPRVGPGQFYRIGAEPAMQDTEIRACVRVGLLLLFCSHLGR